MLAAGGKVTVDLTMSVDVDVGLVGLRWHQSLSDIFLGWVEVVGRDHDLDLERFLGATIGLTLRGAGRRVQYLWGEVDRVEQGRQQRGQAGYRLRVVPELARLSAARRWRAFSDVTVEDVVRQVLAEHGITPPLVRIDRSLEVRELIVQHGESDLAFVGRLLAEEAIWWTFTHDSGGHRAVVTDRSTDHRRKLPMVHTASDGDGLLEWTATAELVDGSARRSSSGRAVTVGIDAGEVVHVTGHDRHDQNTAHVVTVVDIVVDVHDDETPATVDVPGEVVTDLVAVPVESVPIVVDDPDPLEPGTAPSLTATVTGPAGEDLYIDDEGRIQVLIHWPDGTDEMPVWVPVAQPWAGDGHGTTFWPHVGDRVWVEFEGGDLSRPVVTASLYTDESPPPRPLPANKRATLVHGPAGELVLDDFDRLVLDAGGVLELSAGDNLTVTTANDGLVFALGALSITAEQGVTLSSGQASITLDKNGTILLQGGDILLAGQDTIALTSPSVTGT